MRTLVGTCTGALIAALAGPAAADGVADSKALIEKYSKLPSFEAPGPAFDAKACMKDKKIFAIPLTDDNPFEVAILGGMQQRGQDRSASISDAWQTQLSPDQWTQGINKAVEEHYNLIDLVGGLPPEYIAPQIAEARAQGRQSRDDARLRLHPDTAHFSRRLRQDRLRDGRQADRRLDDRQDRTAK